jgi:hypothetical protein
MTNTGWPAAKKYPTPGFGWISKFDIFIFNPDPGCLVKCFRAIEITEK